MTDLPSPSEPIRVLVCGGRTYADRERVNDVLGRLNVAVLAHGAARGADTLAHLWAIRNGIPTRVYPADWQAFGRGAGVIRNKEMLSNFKPNLVVAFPGGAGTQSMVDLAREANVAVLMVLA